MSEHNSELEQTDGESAESDDVRSSLVEPDEQPTESLEVKPSAPRSNFVGTAFRFQIGMVLVSLLLGGLLKTNPWLLFDWSLDSVVIGFVGTIPLLIVMWLLQLIPIKSFQQIEELLINKVAPLLEPAGKFTLLILALLVGLGEELLFRGVLQEYLTNFFTPLWAIVLASVVFGLVHFISATYIIIVFGMSLYLGYSGILFSPEGELNLVPPVLIHTFYDYLVFLFMIHKYRKRKLENTESQNSELDE